MLTLLLLPPEAPSPTQTTAAVPLLPLAGDSSSAARLERALGNPALTKSLRQERDWAPISGRGGRWSVLAAPKGNRNSGVVSTTR